MGMKGSKHSNIARRDVFKNYLGLLVVCGVAGVMFLKLDKEW